MVHLYRYRRFYNKLVREYIDPGVFRWDGAPTVNGVPSPNAWLFHCSTLIFLQAGRRWEDSSEVTISASASNENENLLSIDKRLRLGVSDIDFMLPKSESRAAVLVVVIWSIYLTPFKLEPWLVEIHRRMTPQLSSRASVTHVHTGTTAWTILENPISETQTRWDIYGALL